MRDHMTNTTDEDTSRRQAQWAKLFFPIAIIAALGSTIGTYYGAIQGSSGSSDLEGLAIVIGFGTFVALMSAVFLQRSSRDRESAQTSYAETEPDTDALSAVLERLTALEEQTAGIADPTDGPSNVAGIDLDQYVREAIDRYAKTDLIDAVRTTVQTSESRSNVMRRMRRLHEDTLRRLRRELSAIRRRSTLNLVVGIWFAIVGIAFLIYVTFSSLTDGELSITGLVQRISIVVVVELFAYFFLRLYGTTVADTRFFQNELTNVEQKFIALEIAAHSDDRGAITRVISTLTQTERNFILEKGQTTVSLERSRDEKDTVASMARALVKAVSSRR